MKQFILLFLLFSTVSSLPAQKYFPEKCLGEWEGEMINHTNKGAQDTIPVSMTIKALTDTIGWTWRTVYHSLEKEIIKDYKLYPSDEESNKYTLDENNGIELYSYMYGNKMYSNFEVDGTYLSSIYILEGDKLIFEIIYGKDLGKTGNDITNFSVDGLQRSVLKRK